MKFLTMIWVNCKRYFKDYKNIILMFILPIACVSLMNFLMNNTKEGLDAKVSIVNLDKGSLGSKFIEELGLKKSYDNIEEGLEDLKNYNVVSVYEIPENFTENLSKSIKPTIKSYKLEEGNNTFLFESKIEDKINKFLKFKILEDNNIVNNEKDLDKNILGVKYNVKEGLLSSEGFMPIVLIMFFLVTFSSSISSDLLGLRKEKILERFLSTNNSGYEIMGSIYISMIITQVIMYTASFIFMKVVFNFSFENFGILILNIALMSMVSISLGVMISRIFKSAEIGNLVITMISIVMFFLYFMGIVGETSTKIPQMVVMLNKFTPFYWALGSIEKSVIFPNAFVLILISLTFFSAGSIKYSTFAKK
ncbi:ABC transporter permease [Clostridium hydrogeniformans]|uniref:ABC transporter permease n=1 Tax=Clostridium hydrogeniformans TaxID=349933 RepID=UPI00048876A4|nr:ABC transporter permease [Clostridium hydrogeniformans]